MKVMIISGEYPSEKAGGIASIVYAFSKELEKRSVEHTVVCTQKFQSESSHCIFLNEYGKSPIRELSFGHSFNRLIKKEGDNWDIFHFHLPNALGPLLLNSKSIKKRSIATIHTTAEGFNKYVYTKTPVEYLTRDELILKFGFVKILARMERVSLYNAKYLIAGSSGVKSEILHWYGNPNVGVIHNGVNLSKLLKRSISPSDRPKILFVGRLSSQKGLLNGIAALSGVKHEFELLVVGAGPYRSMLEQYCAERNVPARFLGYVDESDLYDLYASSYLLLMPSLYEGFPTVAIEAAGSGLPIAAFTEAKLDRILCKENRILLGSSGNIDNLRKTIDYFLSDRKLSREIGLTNAKQVEANLTAEKMVDNYMRVYSKIYDG